MMVKQVRCLCKHKDLSLVPQPPGEKLGVAGTGSSLGLTGQLVSPRFHERIR